MATLLEPAHPCLQELLAGLEKGAVMPEDSHTPLPAGTAQAAVDTTTAAIAPDDTSFGPDDVATLVANAFSDGLEFAALQEQLRQEGAMARLLEAEAAAEKQREGRLAAETLLRRGRRTNDALVVEIESLQGELLRRSEEDHAAARSEAITMCELRMRVTYLTGQLERQSGKGAPLALARSQLAAAQKLVGELRSQLAAAADRLAEREAAAAAARAGQQQAEAERLQHAAQLESARLGVKRFEERVATMEGGLVVVRERVAQLQQAEALARKGQRAAEEGRQQAQAAAEAASVRASGLAAQQQEAHAAQLRRLEQAAEAGRMAAHAAGAELAERLKQLQQQLDAERAERRAGERASAASIAAAQEDMRLQQLETARLRQELRGERVKGRAAAATAIAEKEAAQQEIAHLKAQLAAALETAQRQGIEQLASEPSAADSPPQPATPASTSGAGAARLLRHSSSGASSGSSRAGSFILRRLQADDASPVRTPQRFDSLGARDTSAGDDAQQSEAPVAGHSSAASYGGAWFRAGEAAAAVVGAVAGTVAGTVVVSLGVAIGLVQCCRRQG
ncbi:hypothetical protein MNEG_5981 [Monoraphidium neglectum]|uniref:Uncharacterized protein n=1 Tax=Monoraphidium neglectum TaxID=145388 RepID=A0A0D2L4B7_9CHLO|nr:hypothetical protein MNEG_5981 [Monoraphidium neglectum]KIZ01979.1 hypothetical protein MNEG_5981 [Monoraphidium neglectum]|eukprot:XP_013900998.1 hypothetical protein MNEG_5981 [Monoraphidium neglectum]